MTTLHLPTWAWAATIAALAALLAADLIVSGRRRTPTRLWEAAGWTLASVLLAMGFGAMLAVLSGGAAAGQFYAGWLTEYSLSLDNLFVFLLLIGSSGVPRQHHGRVLLLGILAALGLRGVFIGLGAAALRQFGWVEYVFGAFLLFTAAAMVWRRNRDDEEKENAALRAARRVLPVADGYRGGGLTTRVGGRLLATPLLILVIAIGVTDVMFAFDSIPAIFGLTRNPFLVFTANLFALLGLRHLYFLVGGLLSRLVHLAAGLSVILAFIGLKIIAEALRGSGLERLGPLPLPQVSPLVSLAMIAGVLAITTLTSLAADWRTRRRQAANGPDGHAPPRTRTGDRPAAVTPLVVPAAGLTALSSVISPGAIGPSDISRAAVRPAAHRASAAAGAADPVLRVVWRARTGAEPVSQRPPAIAPRRSGAGGPAAEPAQGTLAFRPALSAGREHRRWHGPPAGAPVARRPAAPAIRAAADEVRRRERPAGGRRRRRSAP